MKKCPACAEEIQDEAIKCKHCGESLNGPKFKKKSNWVWWALGIVFLFWVMASNKNEAPQKVNDSNPRSILYSEILSALGAGNRHIPRLTALKLNEPEKGEILVNWATNDNLTSNMRNLSAQNDVGKILKAIHKMGIDYTFVSLVGSAVMADKFGNAKEMGVINLTFYKETVEKINWDNFWVGDIYTIADKASVHSQFQYSQ